MKDLREIIMKSIEEKLLENGFEYTRIKKVSDIVMLTLNDFEITNKSRELAVIDSEQDQILKMYKGTLLTEGKSLKTVANYIRIINRFLMYINKKIPDITSMDIRVWLASVQQNASLRTCENYRSYLSTFFTWLTTEEFIDKNPMNKIKPIKYSEKEKYSFTSTDIDAIRSSCNTLRLRAEVELLISSGVRVEELTNLKLSDIDFDKLEVRVQHGKGGKYRVTYMSEVCAVHLKNYLNSRTDDSEFLLISKFKTQISKGGVRRDMRLLSEASNIENIHPHRFRRTFATNLWARGMDIRTIQILLGHSNINTTMTYIANDTERVKSEYKRHA